MSLFLLGLNVVTYFYITIDECIKGNWPIVIIFVGYTISSIGYMWMLK